MLQIIASTKQWSICAVLISSVLSGCGAAAPGADHVKVTRNPSDVAACTAVGNIDSETMNNLDSHVAQNKAVGLGANVVLHTGDGGVAYHCN
jgi:hypothetical protein